jgi:hypothetical protein
MSRFYQDLVGCLPLIELWDTLQKAHPIPSIACDIHMYVRAFGS